MEHFSHLPKDTQKTLKLWFQKFESINKILQLTFIAEDIATGEEWLNAYNFGPEISLSPNYNWLCNVELHWGNRARVLLSEVQRHPGGMNPELCAHFNAAIEKEYLLDTGTVTPSPGDGWVSEMTWQEAYELCFRLACAFKRDLELYPPVPEKPADVM